MFLYIGRCDLLDFYITLKSEIRCGGVWVLLLFLHTQGLPVAHLIWDSGTHYVHQASHILTEICLPRELGQAGTQPSKYRKEPSDGKLVWRQTGITNIMTKRKVKYSQYVNNNNNKQQQCHQRALGKDKIRTGTKKFNWTWQVFGDWMWSIKHWTKFKESPRLQTEQWGWWRSNKEQVERSGGRSAEESKRKVRTEALHLLIQVELKPHVGPRDRGDQGKHREEQTPQPRLLADPSTNFILMSQFNHFPNTTVLHLPLISHIFETSYS